MRNDTVDRDDEPTMMVYSDYDEYISGNIGGVITYITGIDVLDENPTDNSSPITKAHKLVLLFKFVAALGKIRIPPLSLKRITKNAELIFGDSLHELLANGFEYFAPLLT